MKSVWMKLIRTADMSREHSHCNSLQAGGLVLASGFALANGDQQWPGD
jgi:hypothetical protein